MGWSKVSDKVQLNDALIGLLDELSNKVSFDFEVTSGVRSARAQADAMFTKIELGDTTLSDYRNRDYAQAIIDAHPDLDLATERIIDFADNGVGSVHLSGKALDFRIYTLSEAQKQELLQAIKDSGGRAIVEEIPPHIHASFPDLELGKKNTGLIVAAIAIGAALWTFRG
tara:strand:+ start:2469 stop:2978 length:510 start_codon:yes stop_codon:yes gene_type:complete